MGTSLTGWQSCKRLQLIGYWQGNRFKALGHRHQNEPGPQRPLNTHVHKKQLFMLFVFICTVGFQLALHYNLESNMCHWHHYIKDLAFINGQRYCVYCGPDSRETGCSAAPSTSTLTHISPFLQEFLEIYHLCTEASVAPAYRREKNPQTDWCVSYPLILGVYMR